nr:hypothetical protein [Tanacetum cinerariifolium]
MSDHEDETIPAENAPSKNIPQITTVTNISAKFPYLKKGEYDIWAMKMQNFISSSDLLCWNIVRKGNSAKSMTTDKDGNLKIRPPVTVEEHQQVQRKEKARTILLSALPDEHMGDFYRMIDARDIWNAIKARFGGNAESKKMQKFAVAVVSPHSETKFAFVGLSYEAAQEKQELMTKLDNEIANQAKWNNSGRNLYKLIDSSMSGQPIYNRFASVDHMKAVPPLLTRNYMPPSNIPDIDESQMVYGKKATDSSEIKADDDSISRSNDSVLSDFSDRSSDSSTNDLQKCDSSVECSRPNHIDHGSNDSISSVSASASESRDTIVIDCASQEDFSSVCTSSIETDVKSSNTLFNKFGSSNKESHFRTYKSVTSKSCYVCGSYLHLIKDCDFHEKRFAKRNAKVKGIFGRRKTGKPVNPNRPKPVSAGQPNPVSAGRPKPVSVGRPKPVSAGRPKPVFAGCPNPVSADKPNPVSADQPNPVYAGHPNIVFAGDGILGPRPLNFQPKSTYFHSFTHNNQQIIFPITYNLLYSLYMTGWLNGKTAVKPSADSGILDILLCIFHFYNNCHLLSCVFRFYEFLQMGFKDVHGASSFTSYVDVDTSCCSTLNPHTAHMTIYYWKLDNKQVIIQFRGGLLGIGIPAARAFCFCCQVFISAGDLFLLKSIDNNLEGAERPTQVDIPDNAEQEETPEQPETDKYENAHILATMAKEIKEMISQEIAKALVAAFSHLKEYFALEQEQETKKRERSPPKRRIEQGGSSNRSFISELFSQNFIVPISQLKPPLDVEIANSKIIHVANVFQNCEVEIDNEKFSIDLIPMPVGEIDVVIGMDWLSKYDAIISCQNKLIRIKTLSGGETFIYGDRKKTSLDICTYARTKRHLAHGCQAYLAHIIDTQKSTPCLDNISVVREFPDVFPEELPGIPPDKQVFRIDLIPGCTPVVKTPYRLAPSEMQELMKPDISYAVQQGYLHMHDPREPHLSTLKRILRLGVPLLGDQLSGIVYFLATTCFLGPLSVSQRFLVLVQRRSIVVLLIAVYLSCNPVQHQRTKHIEIHIHFVRDLVAAGQVHVLHVPSRYQFADFHKRVTFSII